MKRAIIHMVSAIFLFVPSLSDITTILDPECDNDLNTSYIAFLSIMDLNNQESACTGALISPWIVVTPGYCCHIAYTIDVFAFYNKVNQTWNQTREAWATNVFQSSPEIPPKDNLCLIEVRKKFDLGDVDSKIEIFNDTITDDHTLDVIALLVTKDENGSSIINFTCRLAEVEENDTCDEHYQNKFYSSMSGLCITNGFVTSQSCEGAIGAVVQLDNKVVGVTRTYFENCSTTKYSYYHALRDNYRFIQLIMANGQDVVKYSIIGLIVFTLIVETLRINRL